MTDDDRIREAYRGYDASARARLWDRSNPGYRRLADDRDAALLSLIGDSLNTERSRFLDIGCGDGYLVARVQATWPAVAVTGIDLLPDRIDAARSVAPTATFVVGSADALPFEDNTFDCVSVVTLFSSLPSDALEDAVAAEVTRVLVRGGWLVWYDLRYDNPRNRAVHGIPRARLKALFPGWHGLMDTVTVAPPIARRLGPLTPLAYPLLHAVPPLRSHLIGRLRCPT